MTAADKPILSPDVETSWCAIRNWTGKSRMRLSLAAFGGCIQKSDQADADQGVTRMRKSWRGYPTAPDLEQEIRRIYERSGGTIRFPMQSLILGLKRRGLRVFVLSSYSASPDRTTQKMDFLPLLDGTSSVLQLYQTEETTVICSPNTKLIRPEPSFWTTIAIM
ncbi:MAG: hypothetical protein ACLUOI_16645 [Eisenbergiella sp.]